MAGISGRILVVDDEEQACELLSHLIERQGLIPLVAHEGETALRMLRSEHPDAVLLDFRMPGMDGLAVLRRAHEMDPGLPIIMISAFAGIDGAVEAMKAGARDYLSKPFAIADLTRVIRTALAERQTKPKGAVPGVSWERPLWETMGPSDAVARLSADVNRVAKSGFTVVIMGETGAGKELVARAIHAASPRSAHPFVPVDCGAIPEALFESELFGHEKGSFTGADGRKQGVIEAAHGGTLFLDEMTNMPLNSQAKLLRVLQEKTLCRVGSTRPISVDVRVVAASNQDLETEVARGDFRHDLFFRLNEFAIRIPPLRERKEDIPYLAKRFLDLTNHELGKSVAGFAESAMKALFAYDWPGNVRQLRSTIRRAVLLADLLVDDADLEIDRPAASPEPPRRRALNGYHRPLKEIVRECTIALEREVLCRVLQETDGNKAKAARLLQVDYKTIHTKIKEYGIGASGGNSYV